MVRVREKSGRRREDPPTALLNWLTLFPVPKL